MGSWALLRTFLPWGDFPVKDTPLFGREGSHTHIWQRASTYLGRLPITNIVFVAILAFLAIRVIDPPYAAYCLDGLLLLVGPPILLLPSLLLWVLPLGFVLAPIVARERHYGVWEMLRVTPYSTEEIVTSKVRGALWELRGLITRLGGLQAQIIAATLLGLGFMQFLSLVQEWPGDLNATGRTALCGGVLLLLFALFIVFFLDRAQQLTLMIVAALAASTSATSTQTGLTRAITAAFVAWGVDVGFAIAVLLVQPLGEIQDFEFSAAAIIMLGPIAGYTIELKPLPIALLIASTLMVREITIRVLWRIALNGAQKLV